MHSNFVDLQWHKADLKVIATLITYCVRFVFQCYSYAYTLFIHTNNYDYRIVLSLHISHRVIKTCFNIEVTHICVAIGAILMHTLLPQS